eukprot:m.231400 g.231400  ORF g.231400 m.231400 type:complete len:396 (-) comp12210_c0_seq1:378-1565(-)
MRAVVAAADGQQHDVLAGRLLERQGDGDGAALTRQVRIHPEHTLDRVAAGNIVRVVDVAEPRLAGVLERDSQLVRRAELGKLIVQILAHNRLDLGGHHVRDKTDRELANDLARNHGLGTAAVPRTLHAVDGERREAPAAHEDLLLGAARQRTDGPDLAAESLGVERDALVHLLLLVGDGGDRVHDAGDLDVALRVDERREQAEQVDRRLVHRAAKHAGVQVLRATLDLNHEVAQPAQAVRDARLGRAEPVVVRDAERIDVAEELALLALDKVIQADGPALLHSLEAHLDVHGDGHASRLEGLDGPEPREHGALVVRRATAVERTIGGLGQDKRLGVPAIGQRGGLDIEVPIDANRLLGRIVAELREDDRREGQLRAVLERLLAEVALLLRHALGH